MATVNLGKIKPLWKGDYSASETYRPLDFVEYNGQLYINILESIGNLPTNTTYFELVVEPNNIVHAPGTGLPNEAGTAYARNVTTSATDTTAGRLLKVGDFGTTSNAISVGIVDCDTLERIGNYWVDSTSTNKPVGTSAGIVEVYSSLSGTEVATRQRFTTSLFTSTIRTFFRGKNSSGTWQPWQEIYHTGNILGTVSATGTYPNLVPTGAIMESGSNSNGEYVKYANGTMICFVVIPAGTTSSGSGRYDKLYPATFAFNDPFRCAVGSEDQGSSFTRFYNTTSVSTSSTAVFSTYLGVSSIPFDIKYTIFGRWF